MILRCSFVFRVVGTTLLVAMLAVPFVHASEPGLPFVEDFADSQLLDQEASNANWSTEKQALFLAWREKSFGAFVFGLAGTDITSDVNKTQSVALRDVNGDGYRDLIVGNALGQPNRLYVNNGTPDPWLGVSGQDISSDGGDTRSVVLGDVDRDGDFDLVVGNSGVNRLYLNDGTGDPWDTVTAGIDITSDSHTTESVALADVDYDGDLDLVAGNAGINRLYLNQCENGLDCNGTVSPWSGVVGMNITADMQLTQSAMLADVDDDYDVDLVVGNGSGARNRLYLNQCAESSACDGTTVNPWTGTPGIEITDDEHDTRSVELGDIDGDGDIDLIAGNVGAPNRFYPNNGTAAPWNGVVGSDITTDAHDTESVGLGDVDGDGDVDVIAGNDGQANRLYLNNGTADPWFGVLGTDITPDGDATKGVALGDVDADGDLDLVAGNFNQTNRLYLNHANLDPWNGVLGSNVSADETHTRSMALGDVDGDGDLDVVVGNWEGSGTGKLNYLYRNNGTPDPWNGVAAEVIGTDQYWTGAMLLADVEGDGDLDLVTGDRNENCQVYFNNGTDDPWNGLTTGSPIGLPMIDWLDTTSIAVGDVDGDGDLDLVEGVWDNTNPNHLYLNDGDSDPWTGVAGIDITSQAPTTTSMALGDVDGDGDLDLVTGVNGFDPGQSSLLFLNDGEGLPWDTLSGGTPITDDYYRTWALALGDVDGDGDLDLVTGNYNQANRLYLNNGTADPWGGVSGADIGVPPDNARITLHVALVDVDRDGDLDLLVGNDGATNQLYLNNGTPDPWFGVSGTDISTEEHQTKAAVHGDVDGDGDPDFISGNYGELNRFYRNYGWPDPWNGVVGADITGDSHLTLSVALGDVDDDGDFDLVAGNSGPNRLYLNNGTDFPWDGVEGADVTADNDVTRSLALHDVDADGDLDLVTGNAQHNRLYLNNGSGDPWGGGVGEAITLDLYDTHSVTLGDVDGDGDEDLVAGNASLQFNRFYPSNCADTGSCDGTVNPWAVATGSDITLDPFDTHSVLLADVDGDGDLDLVTGNTGINRLYLNNGTSSPWWGVAGMDITSDAHDTRAVALSDVDEDGDLDLVAGNATSQINRLYLSGCADTGSCDGTFNPWTGVSGIDVTTDAHDTTSVTLIDIDSDGDLDLVAGNSNNQVDRVYLNNGTSDPWNGVTGMNVTDDALDTRSTAHGDLDADGDPDLVTGSNGTNRLYRRVLHHLEHGRIVSLEVDTEENPISDVTFCAVDSMASPVPNTGIDYYLSNNGGQSWFLVRSGIRFDFPTTGSDLRWRTELHSLSPGLSPSVHEIKITPGDDTDCDGASSGVDCDALDSDLWDRPGEVPSLNFTNKTTMIWTAPADPGSSSWNYELLRSIVPADFVSFGECVLPTGTPNTWAEDIQAPPVDGTYFYLVRAVNGCPQGDGLLGTDWDGQERHGLICP